MNFDKKINDSEEYPISFYTEFLEYIQKKYKGQYWQALPRDIAKFLKEMNEDLLED